MKDKLIKWDTALLAKKKGFNSPCYYAYNNRDLKECAIGVRTERPCLFTVELIKTLSFSKEGSELICLAPTQSLLQKALRKNSIEIIVYPTVVGVYTFKIYHLTEIVNIIFIQGRNVIEGGSNQHWKTYEKALEKGLQEGLNYLQNFI
tara:strand:- start:20 stop:463 length:444 start_codon:yes stop_codon:yes gene_type:complete